MIPLSQVQARHRSTSFVRSEATRTFWRGSYFPVGSRSRVLGHDGPVPPFLVHQQLQTAADHRLQCRAVRPGRPATAAVVEYLLLLHSKPETEPEVMEVWLDSLWSLQYMIPSIMYASAGTVTDCTVIGEAFQEARDGMADTTSGSGSRLQMAGTFTHAVHFRLSDRLALDNLQKHPLMSQAQDQVAQLCSMSAHIVFEGMVAKRLEALFRRGDEFASGIEHILLLRPGRNSGEAADVFLDKLAALAESSVAGGIQASRGAVICCFHASATHVLMTRFAAAQQIQQFLHTPACAAVMQHDPRVPVVAATSLCVTLQPAEESTKIDGAAGLSL